VCGVRGPRRDRDYETAKEGLDMSETQSPNNQSPKETLLGMALGYMLARAVHVAAEMGIADLLSDGPKRVEELAQATGARPPSLYRLLRALAGNGIFAEDSSGRFELTPPAEWLRSDIPGSLRDAVRLAGDITGESKWWNMWSDLQRCVMTGDPEWDRLYQTDFYTHLASAPEANQWWSRGVASFAATEVAPIVDSYDFSPFKRIVDVGGGRGSLLAEILKRNPNARGVLYDHPLIVKEPEYLAAAGVLDRCELIGGNFLQSVPAGGDAYISKRILMDWDDDDCVKLLRLCARQCLNTGACLPSSRCCHRVTNRIPANWSTFS
jgi:O-methyltransferase domain/Dimerisation domain